MAARGLLLLLLGAAVVAPEPHQDVMQQSLELRPPPIQQLLQDPDPGPLPDAAAAAATAPPWGPRSVRGFPPPWPTAAAVKRLCRERPPPPPAPALPPSSFGHLRRQAAAVGALRGRLGACCACAAPLPCARRAWSAVLDSFCAEEFAVKSRPFHCCRPRGARRRRCFREAAPERDPGAPLPPRGPAGFPAPMARNGSREGADEAALCTGAAGGHHLALPTPPPGAAHLH